MSSGLDRVLFRTGRVGAVYGVRLTDGRDVVVKVQRGAVPDLDPLTAAVACQRHLAAHGYPCPTPLDGPATTAGLTAVVESLLAVGEPGDVRDPRVREAVARSLVDQVRLLRELPEAVRALTDPPAWARYRGGPWPVPHDTLFDFSATPVGYAWLDELAGSAAAVLRAADGEVVVGHSDWSAGNLRFAGGRVVAGYDWDSLVADPEAVVAGSTAGTYPNGGATGDSAPSPAEVVALLVDLERYRGTPFTPVEQVVCAAAATWALAYNACCELAFLVPSDPPVAGTSLSALAERSGEYLSIRW